MICLIFEELDSLNELLSCRLVSKRCNEAIASMRIESLAIEPKFYNKKSFVNRRYLFTNQSVSSTSRLFEKKPAFLRNIDFLNTAIMRVMLTTVRQLSIKHLVIKSKAEKTTIQNAFNQFTQLVHLQVATLETVQKKFLFLTNVRIFEVLKRSGSLLNLDAPNLRKLLWLGQSESIRLEYPEKLTHLTLEFAKEDDLLKYKNLECLGLTDVIGSRKKLLSLESFPKLQELHLAMPLKKTAIDVMKKWRLLRNLNLKLYIHSVQVENQSEIDKLFVNLEILPPIGDKFIIENYHKIRKHQTVSIKTRVEYNRLIQHFGEPLPADLCSIFVNIQSVSVRGLVNPANFAAFLQKCTAIRRLLIYENRFDDSFYSDLQAYAPFTKCFKLDETSKQISIIL